MRDVVFGQYIPGKSIVHKLDPRTKHGKITVIGGRQSGGLPDHAGLSGRL